MLSGWPRLLCLSLSLSRYIPRLFRRKWASDGNGLSLKLSANYMDFPWRDGGGAGSDVFLSSICLRPAGTDRSHNNRVHTAVFNVCYIIAVVSVFADGSPPDVRSLERAVYISRILQSVGGKKEEFFFQRIILYSFTSDFWITLNIRNYSCRHQL